METKEAKRFLESYSQMVMRNNNKRKIIEELKERANGGQYADYGASRVQGGKACEMKDYVNKYVDLERKYSVLLEEAEQRRYEILKTIEGVAAISEFHANILEMYYVYRLPITTILEKVELQIEASIPENAHARKTVKEVATQIGYSLRQTQYKLARLKEVEKEAVKMFCEQYEKSKNYLIERETFFYDK